MQSQKAVLTAIICLFTIMAIAQPAPIDKNKLQEYFQDQQYDEAVTYLQPIVAEDSSNQAALRLLGYAHYMSENIKDAKQCFLRMFANDTANITANHYLATIYYNRDPDLAMEYYSRLIVLQPNTANYYRSLGELFSRKKQKDTALTFLKEAYAKAPNDPRNLVSLAEVLVDVKDYHEADSLLEIGLGMDSLNVGYLKTRIRSAYEAKDYISVIVPGERIVRLNEPNISALNKLILSYYNLQHYEESIRVCEYMFGAGLESEAVYYYAAKSYARLKNFEKSNEYLGECLTKAISKTAEMYYFSYGENYEATKEYKKAVAAYDTAYYLFKSPIALYNCGRICEVELKNQAMARQYYTRYLQAANPTDADEKKAYAYVKERWGRKPGKK